MLNGKLIAITFLTNGRSSILVKSIRFLIEQFKDPPSLQAHSLVEKKNFPFLLIQDEQFVSYWQKNGH